jgi:serine/threonine-protein kinase
MQVPLKFSIYFFAAALILVNTAGCSKKKAPVPVIADTSLVVPVYDFTNQVALFPTTGIAMDAPGNVYVADPNDELIKMITPAGVAKIIAGGNGKGASNGAGTDASFNYPCALAVDAAGNVYVADAANNLIRKIDPLGRVTTLAGSGAVGSADGAGTAASFSFPQGIAVDNTGTVYIADTGNDLIRKITPGGNVSTIAGKVAAGSANGTGTLATFDIPQGIAVGSDGTVYVADSGNNLIRQITPSGVVSTVAGNGYGNSADGNGVQANFNFPDAMAIDAGNNLYITDARGGVVRKLIPVNAVITLTVSNYNVFGSHTGGIITGAILPNGIACDKDATNIYVVDYAHNRVIKAINR